MRRARSRATRRTASTSAKRDQRDGHDLRLAADVARRRDDRARARRRSRPPTRSDATPPVRSRRHRIPGAGPERRPRAADTISSATPRAQRRSVRPEHARWRPATSIDRRRGGARAAPSAGRGGRAASRHRGRVGSAVLARPVARLERPRRRPSAAGRARAGRPGRAARCWPSSTRSRTSRSRSASRIARRPRGAFARPTVARQLGALVEQRRRACGRARRSAAAAARSSARLAARPLRPRAPPNRAGDRLEGEVVAAGALPDDRLERDVVEEVDLPERLARRRVREVDLDERPLDAEQGVAQRDARVGQPAGVDDRDVEVALVEPVDERALVVRLEEGDRRARARRPVPRSRRGSRRASRTRRSPARASRPGSGSGPGGPGRVVIAGSRAASERRPRPRSTTRRVDVVADDDAVGGRQDPAQPPAGVLLVGREVAEDRVERVGERVARQLERVEQRARSAPARSGGVTPDRRRRSAPPPAGRRRPPRRGAARRSPPAASTRVPERVPEVERDPPAGRARARARRRATTSTFAQRAPLDDLGHGARTRRPPRRRARSPRRRPRAARTAARRRGPPSSPPRRGPPAAGAPAASAGPRRR